MFKKVGLFAACLAASLTLLGLPFNAHAAEGGASKSDAIASDLGLSGRGAVSDARNGVRA